MSEVIIIPEEHSSQQISRLLLPQLKSYIEVKEFPLNKILNYSEGTQLNSFYNHLYGPKNVAKTLSMVEESKKVLERHPALFPCIKYMTILLVEINNCLDHVRKLKEEGEDLRRYKGLQNLPFDANYLTRILFQAYLFQNFISYETDSVKGYESFYTMLHTAYMDALLGRPDYERNLKIALNNAKRYFSSRCAIIEDISMTEILDALIATNSPSEREGLVIRTKTNLRQVRDQMSINRIEEAVRSKDLKLVIIYVGANHYKNLKVLVEGSDCLRIADIQPDIETALEPILELCREEEGKMGRGRSKKTHKKTKKQKRKFFRSSLKSTYSFNL